MSTVLAVSPHLDDAVLSAGGRLAAMAAEGATVTVHTLFAGSPAGAVSDVAAAFHTLMGLGADPVGARGAEDLRACAVLGAHASHGTFLDAVYRVRPGGGWLVDDSPSRATPPEPELESVLSAAVGVLIDTLRPDLVLTCAALGGHVDHVRARDAVLRAAASRSRVPVELWEDLPYALRPVDAPFTGLPPGRVPGPAVAVPVAARHRDAKDRAIACYRSQQAMLWDGADFRQLLADHGRTRGGPGHAERYWPTTAGGDGTGT